MKKETNRYMKNKYNIDNQQRENEHNQKNRNCGKIKIKNLSKLKKVEKKGRKNNFFTLFNLKLQSFSSFTELEHNPE